MSVTYATEAIAKQMASKRAKSLGGRWIAVEDGDRWRVEKATEPPAFQETVTTPDAPAPEPKPEPQPKPATVSETNAFQPVGQPEPAPQPAPAAPTDDIEITFDNGRQTKLYLVIDIAGKTRWFEKARLSLWKVEATGATIRTTVRQMKKWGLAK